MPNDDADKKAREIEAMSASFLQELAKLKKEQSDLFSRIVEKEEKKNLAKLRKSLGLKD